MRAKCRFAAGVVLAGLVVAVCGVSNAAGSGTVASAAGAMLRPVAGGTIRPRQIALRGLLHRGHVARQGQHRSSGPRLFPGTVSAKAAADQGHLAYPAAVPLVGRATSPRSGLNAPAMGLGLTGLGQNCCEPPDVQVAAGPTVVAEMVNLDLAIWTKTGRGLGITRLANFFDTGTHSLSDPRILYDRVSGRWFASIVDVTADSVVVAASATADPSGDWWLYTFSFPGCPDQPRLGLDDNQILVSANLFSSCAHTASYLGSRVAVIAKSEMLSGASASWQLFGAPSLFGIAPAQSLGSDSVGWMASVDPNTSTVVHLYEVVGVPPSTTINQSSVSISAIQTPPKAVQPSGPAIDTGDNRIQDSSWQAGLLYLTFNDACTANGVVNACAAVAAVSTATSAVVWRSDFDIQGGGSFYPAARPDPNGNLLVAFGLSSPTIYPTGAVAAFLAGGQFVPTLGTIQSGSYAVQNTRYGDYFGAATDPTHPDTIWAATEVGNQANGGWGSAIRTATINPELPAAGSVTLAGSPGPTEASVSAAVDPAGTNTVYSFQYGTTPAYGFQTNPGHLGGGTAPATATASLSNLAPRTAYHVRVVATNAAGTIYGPDSTFTTANPPPPPLPTMTFSSARSYVSQTLAGVLTTRFKQRHQYKTSCSRFARTQIDCGFTFSTGPNDYYGHVTVYYLRGSGNQVQWSDQYVIHWVNDYCYFKSGHRIRCKITTKRGSW